MRFVSLLLFLTTIVIGCKSRSKRSVLIEKNLRAVGNIGPDTSYEGPIQFYDTRTNQLLYTCNYQDNLPEGIRTNFHSNGTVSSQQLYHDGKLNGFASFYDSTGTKYAQQYYYHGLRAGPSISWKNGHPESFYFYSLDNRLLFELSYEDLQHGSLTQVQSGFFFFNISDVSVLEGEKAENFSKEILLYLPQPPKFDFQYSVVKIDSGYQVLSTLQKCPPDQVFTTINVAVTDTAGLAIKLVIQDSVKGGTYTMFKRI